MSLILTRAVIRGGRIEVDEPIDLPDGSEVAVSLVGTTNSTETDDEMSAEEIADMLTAMDCMEPLEWTDEEQSAWAVSRQARKEWEKSQFVERAEKLRRNFE